jgi:hypothetical protein
MRAQFVRRGHVLPLAAVAASVFAIGCTDSNTPTTPETAMSAVSTKLSEAELKAATGRGIDAEFTRLARQIPGFGGMYYDRTGKLNVHVKAPAGATPLRSADMLSALRATGGPKVERRLAKNAPVVTKAAKYDFTELQAYRARLTRIFGVKGVVLIDTDEEVNRLRIAITPNARERDVVRELNRAGVPRDAVVISRISPIHRIKTLQQRQRPLPGGFQLVFPAPSIDPGALFVCTLGFNANRPQNPNRRFLVTASHCSDRQGGNQHTPYYNPFPVGANGNRVATEFKDPFYGNPGGQCVFGPGIDCRFSDALLAEYTDDAFQQLGKIARTTFALQRIGSIRVDPDHPRWNVVGEFEFPFLGEIAHKVGRTSGHTFGPVILTCVDVGVGGTNIVQICQDIVLSGAQGGDSGAGVFERASDFGGPANGVVLVGILWGGGTLGGAPIWIFSAMEQIELELGALTTF